QILPDAYEYRICQFSEAEKEENSEPITKFEATIRLKLRTKAEAKLWIKDLERASAVTWRVDKTYPVCGGKKSQNVYRIDMRCQHRTYSRSPTADKKASSKNTCCPAKMFLVVKRTHMASGKLSQSTDQYLQEFPTRVYLDFRHNHKLLSPDILRKRDVSEETVQKLTDLYKAGHTPLSALEEIKRDLQADYGEQFVFVSTDRSKCPDKQFCYRLYYKLFCPKYPKSPGKKMLLELQGHLKPFCEKYDSHCASIEKTEDDNVIVAICPRRPKQFPHENNEENDQRDASLVPQAVQPVNVESYPPHLHLLDQFQSQSDLRGQGIGQCAEGMKTVFDDLLSKIECYPEIYLKPVETFLNNYQNLKKDNEKLVNALQTFGQYSGVTMALSKTLKRQHSGDSSKIDSTTIICAKKKKGARRRLITARPVVQQSTLNHEDSNSEREILIHEMSAHEIAVHEVTAHEISAHEISAHEVSAHEVTAHQVTAHEMSAHEMSAHEIPAHEISTHEISAHEISAHEISAHEISAHEISAHEISTHEISAHDMSAHDMSAHD
ncbi:Highly reducing polyketide synthase gloL-like 1, partial [Homarus americanus]